MATTKDQKADNNASVDVLSAWRQGSHEVVLQKAFRVRLRDGEQEWDDWQDMPIEGPKKPPSN